ncbi:LysM peptidoglycan-binding domain-containing protein [Celeribacter sp. PS-C1]|uniref:LysM peptidoglycan-binding domain-containing protein n=1 Tax=Celeribacter sp. PS-C1 TaxID=2820813 RepID=UPI001CA4B506|nr:LysM peptidoglycan-binding domain-containing protein [Celeribacter sp. PS-C1]MBW6417130.1 LysM peptidoglycan-binding domain-containing protein [Celeribacter sp. PS-C1]
MSKTNGWMLPAAGVGVAVIVVAIGATLYLARPQPETDTAAETAQTAVALSGTEAPAAVVDMAAPASDQGATSEATPEVAEASAQLYPAFDLVRIPPDGLATVAGRAEPGATVSILVNGQEVTNTEASARGEFVALFDLPASGEAREMRLVSKSATEEAQELASAETVLIAPASAPPKSPVSLGDETDVPPDLSSGSGLSGTAESTGVAVATQVLESAGQEAGGSAEQPTVLMADDEGVKVLQQAGTASAELRIDAVTYDPEGRVFVSGRAAPWAELLIYLDGVFLTEARASADGQWRRELEEVAAGRYTLRVDQTGAEGAVISRVETPFQREEIAKLAEIASGPAEGVETTVETTEVAATEVATAASNSPQPRIASVTVQPGNTLWGIASERYGDGYLYVRLFDANRAQIRDPDLIYPGQIFDLPE